MYGLTEQQEFECGESLERREHHWNRILCLMSDVNVAKHGWTAYDKLKTTLKTLQAGLPGYGDP